MKKTVFTALILLSFFDVSVAQMSGIYKKDIEKFSYALLDGRNVTMYAETTFGRNQNKSTTKSGQMMSAVIFSEKNFRMGQTYMVQKQLEQLRNQIQYGEEDRFDFAQMHAYSRGISDLGVVYHHLGLLKKAESMSLWALSMRSKRFGQEDKSTISSLNNVSSLYRDMGNYNEATRGFDRCLELLEKIGYKESVEYAIVLNNLSTLQLKLGQVEKARESSTKAIELADRATGDKSKDFMSFLLNSAIIDQELKNYNAAEVTLLEVKEIKEKRFGKKSSQYARTLNNLAALYLEMGRTDDVEPLLQTAFTIYKKQFGENHPTTANILGNMGRYHYATKNYKKAQEVLERAKKLQGYILGKYHPEYIQTLEALASTYWQLGDNGNAKSEYLLLTKGLTDQVVNYFPVMSEENKTKFWDRSRNQLMQFYSFVLANHIDDPSLVREMYNIHLHTKGLLLSESKKLKSYFENLEDEETKKKYEEWVTLKGELAKFNAMPKKDVYSLGGNILKHSQKIEKIGKELMLKSGRFATAYQQKSYATDSVANKLANNEAAVEVIRIDKYDGGFTANVEYVALILKNDGDPEMVHIPNGGNLETRNFKLYRNSVKLKMADEYSYEAFWAPVAGKLEGIDRIYLSQDGIYNQINVSTLLRPDGDFVISDLSIVCMSSTRALQVERKLSDQKEVLLLGNPDYATDLYAPLPGTKVEVEMIEGILMDNEYKPIVLMDKMAQESLLKSSIDNPRILHISTHGYFMPDSGAKTKKVFGEDIDRVVVNPLLRSGLILAEPKAEPGKFEYSSSLGDEEDGLLTAFEAMSFKLDDTDLVILSACETGLGDVKAGEGVYGLQRAFQVAGADAIVTSLWKVNDQATQMLMTNFYKNWLETGNKQEAFINAQKAIKAEFKDPYYWGAFVMMN